MTKKNALSIDRYLAARCDEPYMFAIKIGAGCLVSSRNKGDGWALLTLIINLIEDLMKNLKQNHHDGFRELLCHSLQAYLNDDRPIKPPTENLSDKERKKRIKRNELIISAVEGVL